MNETLPQQVLEETTGQATRADKLVEWHLEHAPQPWTLGHCKSYLRALVERDIYDKLCSIERCLSASVKNKRGGKRKP